jgi:hypothetical protein
MAARSPVHVRRERTVGNEQLSFAESLRRAHAVLEKDLCDLEEAARAPLPVGRTEWGGRLERTRARLAEHFALEEEDGYMEGVLQRNPNREREVRHLQAEHLQLMEALDALRGKAGTEGGFPDRLGAEVLAWVAGVRSHEHREDALVQEAFNRDVSAED